MPKPYDAVAKDLVDRHPADWLALLGHSAVNAEPIDVEFADTDISTVTSQVDRVLRVHAPEPWLEHIEFETGHHGARLPQSLLRSSVLLTSKYNLMVNSSVILLRPEAYSPALKGVLHYNMSGRPYLTFHYQVVRVWKLSADTLLSGGLGTVPLAPLANVRRGQLPSIISRMKTRFEAETSGSETGDIWTATKILMGLRYEPDFTNDLLKGVTRMRESTTYQEILQEGRQEGRTDGERRMLIRAARPRLGDPTPKTLQTLEAIDSTDLLEALMDRVPAAETWDDLLAGA